MNQCDGFLQVVRKTSAFIEAFCEKDLKNLQIKSLWEYE